MDHEEREDVIEAAVHVSDGAQQRGARSPAHTFRKNLWKRKNRPLSTLYVGPRPRPGLYCLKCGEVTGTKPAYAIARVDEDGHFWIPLNRTSCIRADELTRDRHSTAVNVARISFHRVRLATQLAVKSACPLSISILRISAWPKGWTENRSIPGSPWPNGRNRR